MGVTRFIGDCEPFAAVDVADLVAWITAIPLEDWPQQRRLEDGQIRPSMQTDPTWYGFGFVSDPVVDDLMREFPGCRAYQRMLSVVMPRHSIEPHRDHQAPYWLARVHVPLMTNVNSVFRVGDRNHHMEVGMAYLVNTEAMHGVTNEGTTPRIHMMFDIAKD